MGVILENYKRQQFAEGREEGIALGREEAMREMVGRIVALEAELSARRGAESEENVADGVTKTSGFDENREDALRRIAALERAVVELLGSRRAEVEDDAQK